MKPPRLASLAPATKQTHTSVWEPVKLVLAGLGGLLVLLILGTFMDRESYDKTVLITFLQGQTGFDGMWASALFWKMAFGFILGAMAGYGVGFLVFLEIPPSHRLTVNRLALGAALFLIPVVVFIPAMSAGFLWDDDQEIWGNNSIVQKGPDLANPTFHTNWRGPWEIWTGGITNDKDGDAARLEAGKPTAPALVRLLRPPLRWIEGQVFAKGNPNYRYDANQFADYFPVKTTMLWLEYQLWGSDYEDGHPAGNYPTGHPEASGPPFHIMNILIHALDGLLLWMLLRQLKVPGAWLGALLFVVHPVHSESVAWIAERKNTLSLFFCLLSVSVWVRFEDTGKRSNYVLAFLLFVASLLCKTHMVVLPAVLLLMAWWRRGTLSWRDVWRSIPFWLIGGGLALVTIWFQNDRAIGGERIPIGDWPSRFAGAGVVVWEYLSKALLPINLNTIYANTVFLWWPLTDPKAWMFIAGALVPMTLIAMWAVKELYPTGKPIVDRTPFFVFAYFVGTLTPVLGFCTMSYMRLTLQADHFQYFSDIAIVALAGAIIAILYQKADAVWRPVLVSSCVLLVFSFCAYSWERAGVHLSEKTLWEACLKKNNDSWQAHNHIGAEYYKTGRFDEAAPHFADAVRLKPENPEVHNNLGLVLWRHREDPVMRAKAIAEYREAVRIKGEVVALRQNLAGALMEIGEYADAAEQFKAILKEVPMDPNMHGTLGSLYAELKRFEDAKKEFENALKIDPNNRAAKQNLEQLRRMGK